MTGCFFRSIYNSSISEGQSMHAPLSLWWRLHSYVIIMPVFIKFFQQKRGEEYKNLYLEADCWIGNICDATVSQLTKLVMSWKRSWRILQNSSILLYVQSLRVLVLLVSRATNQAWLFSKSPKSFWNRNTKRVCLTLLNE